HVSYATTCNYSYFFSSRRRHTRSKRDWSSDVCCSDLFLNNDRIGNRWLNKVVREVNKCTFKNMILLTDGEETFKRVIQVMFSKVEAFTYKEFMLMSLRFEKEYMKHYVDTGLLYDFIEDEVDIVRVEQEAGVDY